MSRQRRRLPVAKVARPDPADRSPLPIQGVAAAVVMAIGLGMVSFLILACAGLFRPSRPSADQAAQQALERSIEAEPAPFSRPRKAKPETPTPAPAPVPVPAAKAPELVVPPPASVVKAPPAPPRVQVVPAAEEKAFPTPVPRRIVPGDVVTILAAAGYTAPAHFDLASMKAGKWFPVDHGTGATVLDVQGGAIKVKLMSRDRVCWLDAKYIVPGTVTVSTDSAPSAPYQPLGKDYRQANSEEAARAEAGSEAGVPIGGIGGISMPARGTGGSVWVPGYTRSDGTPVRGYYRSR